MKRPKVYERLAKAAAIAAPRGDSASGWIKDLPGFLAPGPVAGWLARARLAQTRNEVLSRIVARAKEAMTSRDAILGRVRDALGRKAGDLIPAPPPVRLAVPDMDLAARISAFRERFEALNGNCGWFPTRDAARLAVDEITQRPIGNRIKFPVFCRMRPHCQNGISRSRRTQSSLCRGSGGNHFSALCAGGDRDSGPSLHRRGTTPRVTVAPAHIAVIPASRILVNLDELLQRLRTRRFHLRADIHHGPSRTADIEQISRARCPWAWRGACGDRRGVLTLDSPSNVG